LTIRFPFFILQLATFNGKFCLKGDEDEIS